MKRLSLIILFLALCAIRPDVHAPAAQAAPEIAVKAGELFIDAAAARGRGKYATALYLLSRATELDPGYAEAYAWKAYLLVKLDRPQEALAEAEKALALDANLYSALLHKGYALQKLGRREEALASAKNAVAVNPGPEAGRALLAALGGADNAPAPKDGGKPGGERAAASPPPPAKTPPAKAPPAQAPIAQAPIAQAPIAQAPIAQAPIAQAPPAQAPPARTSPEKAAPAASAPRKNAEPGDLQSLLDALEDIAETPIPDIKTPKAAGSKNYAAQRRPLPRALPDGKFPFTVKDSESIISGTLEKDGKNYHVEGTLSSFGSDTKRFIRIKIILALYLDGKMVDSYPLPLRRIPSTGGFSFKRDFTTDATFNKFGIRARGAYRLSS